MSQDLLQAGSSQSGSAKPREFKSPGAWVQGDGTTREWVGIRKCRELAMYGEMADDGNPPREIDCVDGVMALGWTGSIRVDWSLSATTVIDGSVD
ncbi:hypothetical protein L6452_05701 [Arctium lappa]|uniref:Uncharacterized protein n=1 Tax=Arctium lappa TaxID=4217 RepID=A0ACB9EGT8_ARCLA|nr:hypothetical protein L6452_05701 [Arctium lappa]